MITRTTIWVAGFLVFVVVLEFDSWAFIFGYFTGLIARNLLIIIDATSSKRDV